MRKKLTDTSYYNEGDGKVYRSVEVYLAADEVVSVKKINSKNTAKEPKTSWRKGDKFVKMFPFDVMKVARLLTGMEAAVLMMIVFGLDEESGVLFNEQGKPLTNADVVKISGKSEKTIQDTMIGLVNKKVLLSGRTGRNKMYIVNPYLFVRTTAINSTLVKMFANYEKDIELLERSILRSEKD